MKGRLEFTSNDYGILKIFISFSESPSRAKIEEEVKKATCGYIRVISRDAHISLYLEHTDDHGNILTIEKVDCTHMLTEMYEQIQNSVEGVSGACTY
jgi:hypothetical protein